MAVYTQLGAEALAELIGHYDIGALVSAKGIAEGVSNSNWLIETERGRYVLTMYERRVDVGDLPYFLALVDHLAAKGSPVPATIHDRAGAASRAIGDKTVALFEFLPGVSPTAPTPAQARAAGKALARLHRDAGDFAPIRANSVGPDEWRRLADACGTHGFAAIDPALGGIVSATLPRVLAEWPGSLPRATIHADLFPDNVLMLGNTVTGLIDFYFACTDFAAYDVAVTHAAWCFGGPDETFSPAVSGALLAGYEALRPLSAAERDALPLLAQGAALRFVLTRAFDWINTPANALVTRKDPMAFARRLQVYAESGKAAFS
ncbi:homoserine kinase [Parablastomonas sp. CN1-191]|uniref:homoserine kinase n=1 Tax=Parablastomonas sp. CN1-191 TaxID=3400908 RepID=UPI003BF7C414